MHHQLHDVCEPTQCSEVVQSFRDCILVSVAFDAKENKIFHIVTFHQIFVKRRKN